MKKLLVANIALATVFASLSSAAFAAPRHRAPVEQDTTAPYTQSANEQLLARPSDVVTAEGRVIGADPDPSIRSQLLRDPNPTGY